MNYANWGQRLGAYLIDVLIPAPIWILAYVLDAPKADLGTGQVSGGGAVYYGLGLVGMAIWGYNRWYQAGRTGRSWGRKALGLALVRDSTGQPIGPGLAFARDLAHILDSLPCYIGFLFPIWDSKRQTFADKILQTVVVRG